MIYFGLDLGLGFEASRISADKLHMKQHFESLSFSDDQDVWNYLQSLKSRDLQVPDGFYCVEFTESQPGKICFRCVIKTSERRLLRDILYVRPMLHPRCHIYVKNGKAFCLGVTAHYFEAHEEVSESGLWEITFHNDYLNMPHSKKYTAEECTVACEALVELLIMNAKKVS